MDINHYIALVYSLFAVIGILTNSLIIAATITSKSLHGTCNILIAFCAFSDILHMLGHLPKIVPIVAGHPEISSLSCSLLQIIPTFGVSSGTILVLLIALDRFIALRFATFAGKISLGWYLSAHFGILLTYAAFQYTLVVIYFEDTRVICTLPEAYHGRGKQLGALASFVAYALAVCIYVAVWRAMRSMAGNAAAYARRSRRISRAIFSIMAIVICGWLLSLSIIVLSIAVLKLEGYSLYLGEEVAGIPVNISLSVNYFVLYFTSVDYRRTFRRHLGALPLLGRTFAEAPTKTSVRSGTTGR